MEEYAYICPYCWQQITTLVDLSVEEQEFIEDCEVCCNPIQLRCVVAEGQVVALEADRAQ